MEVIVQDANNIVIEVDQGRSGRGISTVSLITVGADYYLEFTFTDGSTEQVGPIATIVTEVLYAEARNAEATTILKGQPVYLFQAQGNLATVKLAFNTSDATSAKTLGLAAEDIAAGTQGLITCQGTLGGINTSAYNEGDTLYLGATAGTLTNVKPQAPNHLVYIGVVERANAGAGQIYVRVQNGYELDEIHDVRIISPVNGNTLIYDATTSLWKNAGITAGSGISVTNGPGSISVGNTGVLSVSGGTTGLTPATATTGAVTLAGTLATTNGGTGLTSFTANRVFYSSSTSAIGQSANLTFDGTNLGIGRSSPGAPLDMVGTFRWNSNVGGTDVWQRFTVGTGLIYDGTTTATDLAWIRNGGEQMRLTSTGLGIGTSSPGAKLQVETALSNSTPAIFSGSGRALYVKTFSSPTNGVSLGYGDASHLSINSSGNVGIGTSSPAAFLDVRGNGAANISTAILNSNRSTTNAGVLSLSGFNAAVALTEYGRLYSTINTNTAGSEAGSMVFQTTNAGALAERMRLSAAGGLSIGDTTDPGAGGLRVTGNTTLGDASTDTVTVNGYMGVGGAGGSQYGVSILNTALTGTTQRGVRVSPVFTSASTANCIGASFGLSTEAAAFTTSYVYGVRVFDTVKGAGSTITNQVGFAVDDMTVGTNNFGITSAVSSGSNKWNIYASGTAANYFAGNVGIGSSSPAVKLEVNVGSSEAWFTRVAGDIGTSNAAIGLATTATTGQIRSYGDMLFYTTTVGGTIAERMRIDSSGNVGIGTSSPGALLELYGASSAVIRLTDNDGSVEAGSIAGKIEFNNLDATSGGVNAYVAGINESNIEGSIALTFATGTSGTATERLRIDSSGNLLLGGTATPASATASLAIFNGTAPTGSVTNGIVLYAEDVTSSSELKVRDEAGNVTTLSPHNFSMIPEGPSEDMAWAYYSEKDGKRINVDMLKLARMVEKLTGEKLVYTN